jgi:hypothetical protein
METDPPVAAPPQRIYMALAGATPSATYTA